MTTLTTTYQEFQFTAKGNTYGVVTAKGTTNYVAVSKLTNNPFRTAGKIFANFDKAQENYKCAEIKTALIQIEMGLTTPQ